MRSDTESKVPTEGLSAGIRGLMTSVLRSRRYQTGSQADGKHTLANGFYSEPKIFVRFLACGSGRGRILVSE